MKLFLFTNFFPFKKAEPFLINEFHYTQKHFSDISIFPLYGAGSSPIISTGTSQVFDPPLNYPFSKTTIFLKGSFNLAPLRFHLKDLFTKGVIFSPKKMYWFFISLFITRIVLSSSSYKKLLHEINTGGKAILYFYWGDNLSWILPYLRKKINNPNVKIILRLHGSDLYEEHKGNYAPIREKIFGEAHQIFSVSEKGTHYLRKKYPSFSNKIITSYLGVFDNGINFVSQTGTLTIVSASNLVPLKRVHLIFEILQHTKREIHWHHFGSGTLFDALLEKVKTKRPGLNITLHGHVQNKEVISFYKSQPVDLFINVSSSEGLPVSIMEALSFGIPVIATNVGGNPELVNNENGVLIEKDLIPENVSKYIDDFKHNDQLRVNARQTFLEKVNTEKNYSSFYNVILSNDK